MNKAVSDLEEGFRTFCDGEMEKLWVQRDKQTFEIETQTQTATLSQKKIEREIRLGEIEELTNQIAEERARSVEHSNRIAQGRNATNEKIWLYLGNAIEGHSGPFGRVLFDFGRTIKSVSEQEEEGEKAFKKIRRRQRTENRAAQVEAEPNATSFSIKALKEPLRDRKKTKRIRSSGNLMKQTFLTLLNRCAARVGQKSSKEQLKRFLEPAKQSGAQ